MKNLKNDYLWIAAGIIFILGIYFLYENNQYEALSMDINNYEAVEIASQFLSSLHVPVENYETECYVFSNGDNNSYYLKTLGNEEYKALLNREDLPVHGWEIYFHKNQFLDEAQTTYTVFLTHSGRLQGFRREIPDSIHIQTLEQVEALEVMSEFLEEVVGFDLEDFDLVFSNVNTQKNRSDYLFRWETSYTDPEGVLTLDATIQGNIPGAFELSFQLPDDENRGLYITEALISTASIVFIFFLTQFAFYLFIKKYHQGEVWLRQGRNIFIAFYIILIISLINIFPTLGHNVGLGNINVLLTKVILFLLYSLILYLVLSIMVFTSWTVGESIGREIWPKKLRGIDAFLKGRFFTLSSGKSVFYGFILALGIVFVFNILEYVLNDGQNELFISLNNQLSIFDGSYPAVKIIFNALSVSFMSSIVLGFFIINLTYQKWKNKWLSIIITGLVSTLGRVIAVSPPSVSLLPVDLLFVFIFGCAFAYIYFLFDMLTLFSMFFNMVVISKGLVLVASDNSFYVYNSIPLIFMLMLSPLLYIISKIIKDEFVLQNYGLPSHIARISERERLKKEMEIAAKVQLSLLPKENPVLAGYDIAGLSIPAVEAGGDYYDFVKLDNNKIGIAIGDVSGKGVGAAIYMTLTKGILQAHAEENVSPRVVLAKVNKLLYKTIEKNYFVSMFYSILDIENHTISYARAGHNPAIFCSCKGEQPTMLTGEGIALGLEEGSIFTNTLREENTNLKAGDLVVYYTDGFTEAMNESRDQFGEDRLMKLIESNRHKSSSDLIETVVRNVRKFIDNYPQHDDMTIVVVKRM